MIYAFALFLFFLAVLVHEMGHAIAMIKTGIGVKELGIGIGGSRWPRLSHTFVSKKDPEETFTLSLYPLLIGALVRPRHEERIKELPYRDQAFIFGAGIIANIFFTLACMLVLRVFFPEVHSRVFPGWIAPWMLAAAIIPLLWYARAITAYIFPLLRTHPLSLKPVATTKKQTPV